MPDLDDVDRRLIAELRRDGRAPMAQIARAAHVSRATAERRVARMLESGAIAGFTVRAPHRNDDLIRAVTLIEVAGRSTSAVVHGLKGLPEIQRLHTTNGGWDLVAEITATTLPDFDRVLRQIRSIEGVLNSETSLLLSSL